MLSALETAGAGEAARLEELAAKRVVDKAQIKCLAQRRRRELQSRVLYTRPLRPEAGAEVEVFYNPGGCCGGGWERGGTAGVWRCCRVAGVLWRSGSGYCRVDREWHERRKHQKQRPPYQL